ncbi:MAG: FtsW/RodA/SpoVE family cell cycle protein [Defluviitaleaceae bacterium]|nr:FtsW/RodA/SpoVE family cell cycle protein [Defluviitaleaceae bacterium]
MVRYPRSAEAERPFGSQTRPRPAKTRTREPEQVVSVGSMDYTIYLVVVLLTLIGVVMVFSASYVEASNRVAFNNDSFYFLRRNGLMAAGGFILMNLMANISYEHIRRLAPLIYLITLGLLIAVVFIGLASHGAQRWIPFPIIQRFQPSEVAKAATIFMLAYLVDKSPNRLSTWKGLFVMGLVLGVITVLVLYGGFSSGLIVAIIGFGMIFIASPHIMRFIVGGAAGVAAVVGYLIYDANFGDGFRGARFRAWMDPWAYSETRGFQVIQSLYAIASGGFFGSGIGQSRQATFVPEAHHDIIFAIIVEELGLIGSGLILLLFGIFIWRGIKVALNAHSTFAAMTAIGIVLAIGVQALINIAVVTNSIPNTGVTLPFISYGGTSLMVSMGLAGVLLNISRYTKAKDR